MLYREMVAVYIHTLCGQNVGLSDAFAKLRKAIISLLVSVSMSVRMGVFMNFCIWLFIENLARRFQKFH
jgi:hypothetical protein